MKPGLAGTLARGRGAGPEGRGRGRAGLGPCGRAGPRGTGRGQTAGGGAFRDLGRAEGRGRRARALSRRAPSRPPCWLVCGCQTELEAAVTLRAPVAPASSALLEAAAAHPGRPGGAQVSRGLGARGPERTEGADPAPPQSAPRAQLPHHLPEYTPLSLSRVCTSGRIPSYPTGPAPRAGARPLPVWVLIPLQGPPPHHRAPPPFPQGALPLVSSEPRASRALRSSGSPSRPRRPPFRWTHPAPPPRAGRPRPRPGAGRPPLGCRGPPPLRRDPARPSYPTAQRGRGRRSQAPAAFCSAWDGETPPRGPAGLVEVGEGVRGAASSRGPFVSLPVGRLPGA